MRSPLTLIVLVVPLSAGACSRADLGIRPVPRTTGETNPTLEPPGYQDGVSLTDAVDLNSDPNIVEVELEARQSSLELVPGTRTQVLTYNGLLPGPVIRTKVGDRLIVHFKNGLSAPSTIHWHGVRVPNRMDGTPDTQTPVAPGDTFDYDFYVRDAGLFWYHPHVDSASGVAGGLYGALVVEDPAEPAGLGDEVLLVLSDIDVDADGGRRMLLNDTLSEAFGTEGNLILVNGRHQPRLLARAGLRQRWRIVNAGRTRFFSLSLAGHLFERVGGDGGLVEAPIASDTLLVTPGERADVSIVPRGDPGTDVALSWVPYDRGFGTAYGRSAEDILTLHIDAAPALAPSALPPHLRTIAALDPGSATHTQSVLFQDSPPGAAADAGFFQINDGGDSAMLLASVGDTDVWTIENETPWDHPFHLHGFFFQPIDDSGQVVHEWKDTMNVPTMTTRRLIVQYDDRPGDWMYHCHILEHAETGLMSMLMLR